MKNLSLSPGRKIGHGALAGLTGGLVFAIMLAIAGLFEGIAETLGLSGVLTGFVIHVVFSQVLGSLFTLVHADSVFASWGSTAFWGAIYGVVWFTLGPLIGVAWLNEQPLFHIDSVSWVSLAGHIVYGLVVALVSGHLHRRHHGRHSAVAP